METKRKLKYRNEHILGTQIKRQRTVITSRGPEVADVGDWYVIFQNGNTELYTDEHFQTLFSVLEN